MNRGDFALALGRRWKTAGKVLALSLALACKLSAAAPGQAASSAEPIHWWLSSADLKQRLTEQPALAWQTGRRPTEPAVEINPAVRFQIILGLGSSLEPTTCSNLWRMSAADREQTIERVVSPVVGIGMNLMRICIGTPDFTGDPWYSYDDLPAGETDPELKRFTIERDRAYILPVLKLARQKNPELLFIASPWSPPGWMKSNGTMIGGSLLPKSYAAYAQYFVRFIQAYEAEGLPIYAVTVQNEPGVDRAKGMDPKGHYPSCRWTAEQERDFIRDHLGPAMRRAGLTTKLWCYDHNYNVKPSADDFGIGHPRTILSDAGAVKFVSGAAFHGYVGDPSGMSAFHQEFPKVPLHFTEGSVFGVSGSVELIARLRNWASSYNAWVLMLDDQGKPNNGPFDAKYATIALNTKTLKPEFLLDYYLYGQFMKFISRGSVRIESNSVGAAPAQVAFRTSDDLIVLVAANPEEKPSHFELRFRGQSCPVSLPAKSVGTWRWSDAAR